MRIAFEFVFLTYRELIFLMYCSKMFAFTTYFRCVSYSIRVSSKVCWRQHESFCFIITDFLKTSPIPWTCFPEKLPDMASVQVRGAALTMVASTWVQSRNSPSVQRIPAAEHDPHTRAWTNNKIQYFSCSTQPAWCFVLYSYILRTVRC